MKTSSPFRVLLSRRVCSCSNPSSSYLQQPLRTPPTTVRFLCQSARLYAGGAAPQQPASPIPAYGSAELLRRRYQKRQDGNSDDASKAERARTIKRIKWNAYGIALCTLAIAGTIALYPDAPTTQNSDKTKISQLDAPPPTTQGTIVEGGRGKDEPEVERVPSGTSSAPDFPKTIYMTADAPSSSPAAANEGGTQQDVEYQLVGLGIRTVSFLSIQVYVVGLYVAKSDIAALQEKLVHAVADPVATTLVAGEKSDLRQLLLDPARGEDVWNEILRSGGIRTVFRIVPTRNTDFMHLRDGFVRGITARSAHFATERKDPSFQDESFGAALNDFKQAFGGGSRRRLPRGETLLLARDSRGKLTVWNEDRHGARFNMGEIRDERVGRLLWLNYLAGKNVSSEPARQSIVDGVMEFVERPVGTVATQVA